MCRLWVCNAEFFCGLWTLICTSDSTNEAKFKKSVFWDTLIYIVHCTEINFDAVSLSVYGQLMGDK